MHLIGVMSGTSLDGVDLAEIFFRTDNGTWHYQIGKAKTVAYSDAWVSRLKNADALSETELHQLNSEYTQLLGKIISDFIASEKIENLDAICSHGHTILHQPQNGFTLQIGNLPEIAKITGQKVVCDFRVQDVDLGGQGAPLVPIGDRILFAEYEYCLNLGGFSNVSFESDGNRIAFDISPVNTVLNHYANKAGLEFDDRGQLAASGKPDEKLISELNALPYYSMPFPKSLGIESVKAEIFPITEAFEGTTADLLNSFCEHVALQIASALPEKSGKMLVTGGGAYHDFLMGRMEHHLPEIDIIIPDKPTLEFKEALIFALLGALKLRNEINVLASVTGAKKDHASGKIFLP